MGLLWVVRHGRTKANNPNKELIRGWDDFPLSLEGKKDAKSAGSFFRGKRVTKILASDISRTLDTAEEISKVTGIPVTATRALRDWNQGIMQGMLKDAMLPFVKFYQSHPYMRVPDGERYMDFWSRLGKAWNSAVQFTRQFPESRLVLVTHKKDIIVIRNLIAGKGIRDPLDYTNAPLPGGVLEVQVNPDKVSMKQVYGESEKTSLAS